MKKIEDIEKHSNEIPEIIKKWIKEDDNEAGILTTYKNFNSASLYYWIKYVLQDEKNNYHGFKPFKMKRYNFNELINNISMIELNKNEFILVCSETKNSEYVYIFQTSDDSIKKSLDGKFGEDYKKMISKLISMNVVGFYSKENGEKYNSYNNKKIDAEKICTSDKINNLM